MGKVYSGDLRERVMAAYDAGVRPEEIAPHFGITARCIYNWLKLRKERGSLRPRYTRPGPQPKLGEHSERLRELVREHPDATLEELREELPVVVCVGTLHAALRKLGLSRKKKFCMRQNKSGRMCRKSGGSGV